MKTIASPLLRFNTSPETLIHHWMSPRQTLVTRLLRCMSRKRRRTRKASAVYAHPSRGQARQPCQDQTRVERVRNSSQGQTEVASGTKRPLSRAQPASLSQKASNLQLRRRERYSRRRIRTLINRRAVWLSTQQAWKTSMNLPMMSLKMWVEWATRRRRTMKLNLKEASLSQAI